GHVGVRMAGALVAAAELAFHRGDVDHVLAAGRGGRHGRAELADEEEGCGHVAQLDFQQLDRVDLVHLLDPAVGVVQVGDETAGVDRGARLDTGGRGGAGGQGEGGELFGGRAAVAGRRGGGQRGGGAAAEVAQDQGGGQFPGGQRGRFGV